jgi:hypothetical protein
LNSSLPSFSFIPPPPILQLFLVYTQAVRSSPDYSVPLWKNYCWCIQCLAVGYEVGVLFGTESGERQGAFPPPAFREKKSAFRKGRISSANPFSLLLAHRRSCDLSAPVTVENGSYSLSRPAAFTPRAKDGSFFQCGNSLW